MSKKRWRAIKNQEAPTPKPKISQSTISYFERFKAQVIDTFMIYTPILYITAYFILGSAQEFRENESAAFLAVCFYGIIISTFIAFSGQTPGCRAHNIMIVDDHTHQKIGFLRALIRFFMYLISMIIFCGLFVPHIWRKKTTLHDIICKTKVIHKGPITK